MGLWHVQDCVWNRSSLWSNGISCFYCVCSKNNIWINLQVSAKYCQEIISVCFSKKIMDLCYSTCLLKSPTGPPAAGVSFRSAAGTLLSLRRPRPLSQRLLWGAPAGPTTSESSSVFLGIPRCLPSARLFVSPGTRWLTSPSLWHTHASRVYHVFCLEAGSTLFLCRQFLLLIAVWVAYPG